MSVQLNLPAHIKSEHTWLHYSFQYANKLKTRDTKNVINYDDVPCALIRVVDLLAYDIMILYIPKKWRLPPAFLTCKLLRLRLKTYELNSKLLSLYKETFQKTLTNTQI